MSCVEAEHPRYQRHGCVDVWRAGRVDQRTAAWLVGTATLILVSACSGPTSVPVATKSASAAAPATSQPAATQATPAATGPSAAQAVAARPRPRNWVEYRQQAADRIVAANRSATYDGLVPEPLLAIPVLEIELRGDGSVQRINVLRQPRQAVDTVQLASDAVRRAAPFGSVAHLPRPWKFNEVFLFNDDRQFKLRTHDE